MKSPTLFLKLKTLTLVGIVNFNDDHIEAFVNFQFVKNLKRAKI